MGKFVTRRIVPKFQAAFYSMREDRREWIAGRWLYRGGKTSREARREIRRALHG